MEVRQDDSEKAERIAESIMPYLRWDGLKTGFKSRGGTKADQCYGWLGVARQEIAGANPERTVVLELDALAKKVEP